MEGKKWLGSGRRRPAPRRRQPRGPRSRCHHFHRFPLNLNLDLVVLGFLYLHLVVVAPEVNQGWIECNEVWTTPSGRTMLSGTWIRN